MRGLPFIPNTAVRRAVGCSCTRIRRHRRMFRWTGTMFGSFCHPPRGFETLDTDLAKSKQAAGTAKPRAGRWLQRQGVRACGPFSVNSVHGVRGECGPPTASRECAPRNAVRQRQVRLYHGHSSSLPPSCCKVHVTPQSLCHRLAQRTAAAFHPAR